MPSESKGVRVVLGSPAKARSAAGSKAGADAGAGRRSKGAGVDFKERGNDSAGRDLIVRKPMR